MSRARDLSRFANNQAISIDSSLNVGINSTSPDAKLDVVGVISATEFYGDGSNLTGVSSPGLGTALSDDTTSPLNSIYFTNANLSVASTITVNPPSSASAAFTQYANIVLQNDADLIVADGDTFIPDILGIGTDVEEPGTLTGGAGKLRVDNITNKAGTGSPNFPFGMVIAGIFTATGGSFSGNVSVGGTLTYEDVTSIDSVGIITARSGINVTGGDVKIGGQTSNYANSPLEVRSTNAGGDVAIRVTNNTTTNGSKAGIIFTNSTGDYTSAGIAHLRNDNALIFYNGQSAGAGGFDNATERLRITSAGDVGIGDNAPNSNYGTNLSVHSTATDGARLKLSDGTTGKGNTDGLDLISTGGAAYIMNRYAGAMHLATNNTNRVNITSGGLVGVNVTPTQQRLTIDVFNTGTTAASYDGINICNTSSTTNNGSAIVFGQAVAGNSYARIGVINSDRSGGSEDQDIFFGTLGAGSYAERMRISSVGRVGIDNNLTNTYDSTYHQLCIGDGTGNNGMLFHAATNGGSYIGFKDTTDGSVNGLLNYIHNGDYFELRAAGLTRVRVDSDGLKFNADTAAANALDDYEEGTYTPYLMGSTGNPTYTVSTNRSQYVKIGRLVDVTIDMSINIGGQGSGDFFVTLPFVVENNSSKSYSELTSHRNNSWFTEGEYRLGGYTLQNTNQAYPRYMTSSGGNESAITWVTHTNGGGVRIALRWMYYTAT